MLNIARQRVVGLSAKIAITLAATFAGLLVVSALLYQIIVNNTFDRLESNRERTELARVQAILQMQQDDVVYIGQDFGHWDLTYDYVTHKDQKYVQANLSDGEMEFIEAHVVAVFDLQLNTLFARTYDYIGKVDLNLGSVISPSWLARHLPKDNNGLIGFVGTEYGPLIITTQQILKSDGSGTPKGYVVFGRLLEGQILNYMSSLSGHNLILSDQGTGETRRTAAETHFSLPLSGVNGETITNLEFTTPRELHTQANATFVGFMAALATALVATLIVIRLMFNKQVTRVLADLGQKMAGIQTTAQLPELTESTREDEIGDLERSFDAMIERLEQFAKLNEDTNNRLRHTEKLKTLGQLTGGIAHDFNNLLLIIIGNINLAAKTNQNEGEINDFLERALGASEKASSLVKHLLAYAQKQPLRREPVDLVGKLHEMKDLLHRTLRDNILVHVDQYLHTAVVQIDPNQLETAVLNIALNAQDAMPNGGKLVLSLTSEQHAFSTKEDLVECIVMSITDNGQGMSAEVVEHVFEPFFTTKAVGKGSGLGLSMVHGFVQQCGGDVRIKSKLDHGTTIQLILPAEQIVPRLNIEQKHATA